LSVVVQEALDDSRGSEAVG